MMDPITRKTHSLTRRKKLLDTLFRTERDEVLRSLDPERLMLHMMKWKQPVPKNWGGANVPLAIMHSARLVLRQFKYDEKMASARWLVQNKYPLPKQLYIQDGILFGAQYDQ